MLLVDSVFGLIEAIRKKALSITKHQEASKL